MGSTAPKHCGINLAAAQCQTQPFQLPTAIPHTGPKRAQQRLTEDGLQPYHQHPQP